MTQFDLRLKHDVVIQGLAASLVLLATACSQTPVDSPATPTSPTTPAAEQTTDAADSSATDGADQPILSATTGSYDQWLGELTRNAGYETPPPVEVRQVLTDYGQQDDLVHECLAEAGFPRNPLDGSYPIAVGQGEDFDRAMYTCHASYRLDDRFYEPLTDPQMRFIRDFWIESTLPCLADRGYELPPPPSAEVVIAHWDDLMKGYLPVRDLEKAYTLSDSETVELFTACPDMPPMPDVWER